MTTNESAMLSRENTLAIFARTLMKRSAASRSVDSSLVGLSEAEWIECAESFCQAGAASQQPEIDRLTAELAEVRAQRDKLLAEIKAFKTNDDRLQKVIAEIESTKEPT